MATFTVTNTNNSGAGSLRQEILDANALTGKDIINFGGLFNDGLAHTISLTGSSLNITDDLTIQGTNANLLTIKDNSASRVFDIASGITSAINGLTITNSYNGTAGGGAISNEGVFTLNNSIISGNTADNGGGIYNTGSLTVNYSTINGNDVNGDNAKGGGIYNTGSLGVNYSSITGNDGDFFGGGIYNTGSLTVNHSTISGNTALFGGGINNGGQTTVNYSLIAGNDGDFGGGIDSGSTLSGNSSSNISLTVNYSNISDNEASALGGGIRNGDGNATIDHSTISNNKLTPGGAGGGIFNNGTLTLSYSSISGNSVPLGTGGGIFNYGTLTVSYSSISGNFAGEHGGGIYNETFLHTQSTIAIKYSSIDDNQAHLGGGIYNTGTLTVSNSTIKHNRAFGIELEFGDHGYESGEGGGIYNDISGTATLDYSSIACNFDTPQYDSTKFIKLDNLVGKFIKKGSFVRV
ncbi:right-handed parallel beta-helix repeat-containing protein [Nostoc sp. DSM 114160]